MNLVKSISVLICFAFLASCSSPNEKLIPANIDHALSLVDSTEVQGEMLKWIAIYADAPSYEPVNASGEGVTCVDDVGRFLEVLEFEILHNQQRELLPLAAGMTRFLLYLSRADGLWYNFIYEDGSINTEYRTSLASFEWWAVRGLRGLGAGYRIFANLDQYDSLSYQITSRFKSSQTHLDSLFSSYPELITTADGSLRPSWNLQDAPDQSAELLIALAGVHGLGDFDYEREIKYLAEALIGWQYLGENEKYKGMYYCWRNTWHGWGNNQSSALLQAYLILRDERFLSSVKLWADNFVPGLIQANFPAEISHDSLGTWQLREYNQIAYGLGSAYRGLKTLSTITGSKKYADYAEQVFDWFRGQNIAHTQMYDPLTGRCFDGIAEGNRVNRNSGAESTIECLLAIQSHGGW